MFFAALVALTPLLVNFAQSLALTNKARDVTLVDSCIFADSEYLEDLLFSDGEFKTKRLLIDETV